MRLRETTIEVKIGQKDVTLPQTPRRRPARLLYEFKGKQAGRMRKMETGEEKDRFGKGLLTLPDLIPQTFD